MYTASAPTCPLEPTFEPKNSRNRFMCLAKNGRMISGIVRTKVTVRDRPQPAKPNVTRGA